MRPPRSSSAPRGPRGRGAEHMPPWAVPAGREGVGEGRRPPHQPGQWGRHDPPWTSKRCGLAPALSHGGRGGAASPRAHRSAERSTKSACDARRGPAPRGRLESWSYMGCCPGQSARGVAAPGPRLHRTYPSHRPLGVLRQWSGSSHPGHHWPSTSNSLLEPHGSQDSRTVHPQEALSVTRSCEDRSGLCRR
jgi:hypothetical protein